VSTKIKLRIKTGIALDLFEQSVVVRLIRLFIRIRFQTSNGWTEVSDAIIDTGSAVSVLPYSIWKDTNFKILSPKDVILHGIAPQEEAFLQAKIAEIPCVFLDKNQSSSPMKIKAYLLYDDNIPLIIGFEDVLTVAELFCDYKNNMAYLDI
jgi:hypothetical protein